ncbi:MAG: hypothetical protein P1U34_05475 [Coxiellaceae bacterium]|nr:hypothetical protein [Coxiellaceae bacterium]
MKITGYSLITAAALIAITQTTWAGNSLTIINKLSNQITVANNNPDLKPAPNAASISSNGSSNLPASQWVQTGGKNLYVQITPAGGSSAICVTKWGESIIPDTGVFTIAGTASAPTCTYSASNPNAKITWPNPDASASVNGVSGNGTVTFAANAKDSSGDTITYSAAVINGRGKLSKLSVTDGKGTATLSGFAGVISDTESIQIAASAGDVKKALTIETPVKVTGGNVSNTPYRQINVGENYPDLQINDLIDVSGYYPPPPPHTKLSLSITSAPSSIKQNFGLNGSLVSINAPITASQFNNLSKDGCTNYKNTAGKTDSNIKHCTITVADTHGNSRSIPVLINNGLRALSAPELVNKHISHQGVVTGTNYFQLTPTQVEQGIDLHNYVSDPATANKGITFFGDDARVIGQASKDITPSPTSTSTYAQGAVTDISALNTVAHGTLASYGLSIDSTGKLTSSGKLVAGHIYQINLVATAKNGDATEKAYFTFYINANKGKPLLETVNGNQPLTLMYSYTNANLLKNPDAFYNTYKSYIGDINYANNNALKGDAPVNVLALESSGPQYTDDNNYWILNSSKKNVKNQIIYSNTIVNGLGNPKQWLPKLLSNAKADNINVSPDLTFSNPVSADFNTYNFEQREMVVNSIINNYVDINSNGSASNSIAGINLDLEKGTGPNFAPFFKLISDRLAYQGKFFAYYEFADKSFQPSIIASMGPLGVPLVSAYDVGGAGSSAARASQQDYLLDGMSTQNLNTLYDGVFYNNQSCDIGHGDPVHRYSWCNLSMADSMAANEAAWNTIADSPNAYNMTTKQAFIDFNGHYSITQPFAESSTDFSYQELFNPNFATSVGQHSHNVVEAGGGLILTNVDASHNSCVDANGKPLNNQWLVNHDSELSKALASNNLKDPAFKALSTCLFSSDQLKEDGKSFSVAQLSTCGNSPSGKPIPLSKCMLIRSIPSDVDGQGTLAYPSPAGYMQANNKPYLNNGKMDPRMIGYSLFALQNTKAGPNDSEDYFTAAGPGNYNLSIQEPWYVGGHQFNSADPTPKPTTTVYPFDPFYNTQKSKDVINSAWSGVATLQKTTFGKPSS